MSSPRRWRSWGPLSLLSLGLLELGEFDAHKEALLSEMARRGALATAGPDAAGLDAVERLDREQPALRVSLLLVEGAFGPPLVRALSRRLSAPPNYMFLPAGGDGAVPDGLTELGGVRLLPTTP